VYERGRRSRVMVAVREEVHRLHSNFSKTQVVVIKHARDGSKSRVVVILKEEAHLLHSKVRNKSSNPQACEG
jgi:hypothetical protein